MKLTLLGTGCALAVDTYNTCFALTENQETFLVDAGGGNRIFKQLRDANIALNNIRSMFVTHPHTDHILGAIWILRMVGHAMTHQEYQGNFQVYGNETVINFLKYSIKQLIRAKEQPFYGTRILFNVLQDGDTHQLFGRKITYFDIHSSKAPQFGFTYDYAEGKKFTCCGDEPFQPLNREYVKNSDWLLHEAFCLYSERDIFEPYEKKHSTVKDASELAQELNIKNLLLYHTEETHGEDRKALYTAEAQAYYNGNIYVPNDLEEFEL